MKLPHRMLQKCRAKSLPLWTCLCSVYSALHQVLSYTNTTFRQGPAPRQGLGYRRIDDATLAVRVIQGVLKAIRCCYVGDIILGITRNAVEVYFQLNYICEFLRLRVRAMHKVWLTPRMDWLQACTLLKKLYHSGETCAFFMMPFSALSLAS